MDEIIGKSDFDFFSKEFAEKTYAAEKEIITTGKPRINEERLDIDKTGAHRWLLVSRFPFTDEKSGTIKGVIGTWHDITENRQQRDRLEVALQEKQLLMQELNHRVKNNLLVVASLIDLKVSLLDNGIDLTDLRNQVNAIVKVYELLQTSADISHISLKSLVDDILSSVFHSPASEHVTIRSDIPDISVPTKTAVPLGLIINELATNALQHSFTAEEGACFTVALEEEADTRQYVLTISNSGRPFPQDTDIENPRGLGLQLVAALVAQLQGTIELQREPQPLFTIRFCGS